MRKVFKMRGSLIIIICRMVSFRTPAKVDYFSHFESFNIKLKEELSVHLLAGWKNLERTYCKDKKVKFNEEINKVHMFQKWIQREVDSSSKELTNDE
jgi:hypothetical protein